MGRYAYTPYMRLKLKAIRDKRGISLRRLADKAGVEFSTVHRIEREKVTPRLATLARLAKALKVTVADLIGEGKPARRRAGRR